MTKLTKVQKFQAILNAVNGVEFEFDATEFLNHEIELLNRKSTSHKPTKTQTENEEFKAEILATLTYSGVTVTELQERSTVLGGLSNQRVSALLRQLITAGEVVKTVDKKKSYFALANKDEDEGE